LTISAHKMSLAVLCCTEAFSLNISMLNIFLLSSVFPNRRMLSRFRCGCHGLHVDTGRWIGSERKGRLCQVCHSLQDVEDEQHFIFDCPAYSHIRNKHANLFQQTCTCTVPGFIARCEPNAYGEFLRE